MRASDNADVERCTAVYKDVQDLWFGGSLTNSYDEPMEWHW
jgi:hypothetical protein